MTIIHCLLIRSIFPPVQSLQEKNGLKRGEDGLKAGGFFYWPDAYTVLPIIQFKGLRLTARRRPSNDVWRMVWEDWAEILRANPGREGYVKN